MKEKDSKKSKVHTRYKLKDGTAIPGTTTITGLLAKPQLIVWANKLGLEGIDSSKYVDSKAEAGTLAHALILAHLTQQKADTSEYSEHTIDLAENSFLKYLEWETKHKVEPILCEAELVSEKHRFGGTIDFYGKVDDVPILLDFKTGKAIYTEMSLQLAGYMILLDENNHLPVCAIILRIGRDETEGFEEKTFTDLKVQKKAFLSLLEVYYCLKELK